MSTALSTGRTSGETSVCESAATKRRDERERERRHKAARRENLKKQQEKASHREAFFLSEFGSGRGVGFEKKGKAPDSA